LVDEPNSLTSASAGGQLEQLCDVNNSMTTGAAPSDVSDKAAGRSMRTHPIERVHIPTIHKARANFPKTCGIIAPRFSFLVGVRKVTPVRL
jgi:hypothetical protein